MILRRVQASVSRIWRWEFWPPWIFYAPLVPWIGWLALRHRGLTIITAANPGIPLGGVVGESKYDILTRLPAEWIVPSALIPGASAGPSAARRAEQVERIMRERGWQFPLILKPDAGQRGVGVKLIRSRADLEVYLPRHPDTVLAQVYDPGPFEAGIFYYRIPGEDCGHIFSITDKHFPFVVGDGESTVELLILNHVRYRMQAGKFFARLNGQLERILGPEESFQLAVAGNHCQGTMFRDGAHLITPELEQSIDLIARGFEGFFFGRFDIRYADVDAFKAGREFAIVELNGATSESTNIYDPSWSLWSAYSVLFRQWSLLFTIGAMNRRAGVSATPFAELTRRTWEHYRNRRVDPVSD